MRNYILFGAVLAIVAGVMSVYIFDANIASAKSLQGPAGRNYPERGRPEAQPPGQGDKRGPGPEAMLFALLDLTSEQKAQIKNIHDAEHQTALPYREQLRASHDQLRTATKDGAFDETAVRALLNQSQQSRVELEVLQLKTRAVIFNVLTAAQKAKFKEMLMKLEKHYDGPPPPPQR